MSIQNNNPPDLTVNESLDMFVNDWLSLHRIQQNAECLSIPFDAAWPSVCYNSSDTTDSGSAFNDGDACYWSPVKQHQNPTQQDMFQRLGDALGLDIHPDLAAFYSRYWSQHLTATTSDGKLELIQVWNQDDMERLRSNLLGQAMDKRKRKQPLSFFFAVTSPEDGMLCVNNDSGEVWFELPGKKPVRKIADSLPLFLQSLTPVLQEPNN